MEFYVVFMRDFLAHTQRVYSLALNLLLGDNSKLEYPSLLCKWQFDLPPPPPISIIIKLVLNCNNKKNSDFFLNPPQSGKFQCQCDRPGAYSSAEPWG
jgi:hypothetical protein